MSNVHQNPNEIELPRIQNDFHLIDDLNYSSTLRSVSVIQSSAASPDTSLVSPKNEDANFLSRSPSISETTRGSPQPIKSTHIIVSSPVHSNREGSPIIVFQPKKNFSAGIKVRTIARACCKLRLANFSIIFFFLFRLLSLMLCINLTTSYQELFKLYEPIQSAQNFIDVMSLEPILAISSGENCNLSMESLPLGEWPGVFLGCLCGDKYTEGACESNSSECFTVNVDHFIFSKWKLNSPQKFDFCVKRAKKNLNYFLSPSGCSKGIECYPGVCFFTDDCPLTSLEVTNTPSADSIKLGDGKYLTRVTDKLQSPLIDVKISYYSLPCLGDVIGYPSGNTNKFLTKPETTCNPSNIDQATFELDRWTEDKLFINNPSSQELNRIPGYIEVSKLTDVVLYGRRRYETTNRARCWITDQKLILDARDGLDALVNFVKPIGVVGVILNSLFLLNLLIILIDRSDTVIGYIVCSSKFSVALDVAQWSVCGGIALKYLSFIEKANDYLEDFKDCLLSDQAKTILELMDLNSELHLDLFKKEFTLALILNIGFGVFLLVLLHKAQKKTIGL